MPKVRTSRTKAPPEGFDEIESTLLEFEQKLKDSTFPRPSSFVYPILTMSSQDDPKRRQKEKRSSLASIPNKSPTIAIYLRSILQARSYFHRTVSMVTKAELRGCKFDCEVEETGIRETLLFEMYSD
jgi:G10 protein